MSLDAGNGGFQANVTYEGYVNNNGTQDPVVLYGGNYYVLGSTNSSLTSVVLQTYVFTACYAGGTGILTDRGEIAVEDLAVGDRVVSVLGGTPAIRWIGHRTIDISTHPRPSDVNPVRVRAGAFGDGLPRRDLRLSPEHAVYVDGVLIPIRHLVNHTSIAPESADRITYWHVELDQHDVILAEGLPAESYLDCDDGVKFDNVAADQGAMAKCVAPCAPIHLQGVVVEAVRSRLSARVAALAAA